MTTVIRTKVDDIITRSPHLPYSFKRKYIREVRERRMQDYLNSKYGR